MDKNIYTTEEIKNILQARYKFVEDMIRWSLDRKQETGLQQYDEYADMWASESVEVKEIAKLFKVTLED